MKQSKIRYILVIIAMCGLLASSVGLTTNVAGLFFTPIAAEFQTLSGAVSLSLTICNFAFALGGILSSKIIKALPIKVLLIAGTSAIAGSTALLALAPNIVLIYILNVIRGLSGGILGFVFVTMVINNWFMTSVALITSITMSCSGFAGALFSPIVSHVIQTSNWRIGYLVVALLMVILNIPAILFLPSLDPRSKNILPMGYQEDSLNLNGPKKINKALPISIIAFIIVCIYSLLGGAATSLPQHFPGIVNAYKRVPAIGSTMLSICMITNSTGKIVLGAMIDRLGTKKSLLIYVSLTLCATLLLLVNPFDSALYVAAGLFGLAYSFPTVGAVSLTKDVFGLANYDKTYPTISLCSTIGNATLTSAIGFMYDFSGSYVPTLIMIGGMFIIIAIIVISVRTQKA